MLKSMTTFWETVDQRFSDLEPYIGKLNKTDYGVLSETEFVNFVPQNLRILMLVFLRKYLGEVENTPIPKSSQTNYQTLTSDKGLYSNDCGSHAFNFNEKLIVPPEIHNNYIPFHNERVPKNDNV